MDDDLAAQRQANRKAMPAVARIVDEFREAFGNLEVVAVEDHTTGRTVGDLVNTFCDDCNPNDCRRPHIVCGHKLATRPDRLPMSFYRGSK